MGTPEMLMFGGSAPYPARELAPWTLVFSQMRLCGAINACS